MRPGPANGRWLALLFGVALAASGRIGLCAEEPPPKGYVREDLKEIGASILRPANWFFRRIIPAFPFYQCSPQPFTGTTEYASGVSIHVMQKTDQPADEMAAARIAQIASGGRVLRGWVRKGVPAEAFTSYGIVFSLQSEETSGVKCTCEIVLIANRLTNTVYQCGVYAPVGEWTAVETPGEELLVSLRLNPKF